MDYSFPIPPPSAHTYASETTHVWLYIVEAAYENPSALSNGSGML